jgi:OFA family oxalate/formate antiporter-like MFS transporter
MKIELHKIPIRELVKDYSNSEEEGVQGYGGKLDIRPKYQREFVYKDEQRNKENMMDKRGIKSLVAGSVLLLFLGVIYVWSKFVAPVTALFSANAAWDADATKLTGSFTLTCFVVGILLGGLLIKKVAPKLLVLAGGLALAAGVFASSFVSAASPALIYLFYGITGGLGVGVAYNAILASAQQWFPTRRGMAVGVSVSSFGFSTVLFAPLVQRLCDAYGVVSTFRILAAVFAAATLALFSFISRPDAISAPKKQGAGDDKTLGEALKSPNLWIMAGLLLFGCAPYLISNPSFQTMAIERGLSASTATVMIMITGIANAAGRLLMPMLAGRITAKRASIVGGVATALSSALLIFVQGPALIPVIAATAFFFGGFSGVSPVLTSDYFGLKNVASIYGVTMIGYMAAALLFPLLFKALALTSEVRFAALAILALIAALLVALLKKR